MNQGVGAQNFDLENPAKNPKLIELQENLDELGNKYHSHSIPIPEELQKLKLTYNDLEFLCQDIRLQNFKFYKVKPGKLVKIASPSLMQHGYRCYVTKNDLGNFEIILKATADKKPIYYTLDNNKVNRWRPYIALTDRIDDLQKQFAQELPPHLQDIFEKDQNDFKSYHTIIMKNLNKINTLKIGKSFTIEPEPQAGRLHPIHILRTESTEYCVLLETGDKKSPFIRIDTEQKEVWKKIEDEFFDEYTIEFIAHLHRAKKHVENNGLPPELAKLIKKEELLDAYQYMFEKTIVLNIRNGQSFQLKKEDTGLARTLNVVRKPNGEFLLMFETKLKLKSNKKDRSRTLGEGTFGKVKPCWRIDSIPPEEWANKVSKAIPSDPETVYNANFEALCSQNLVENLEENKKSQSINVTLLGEFYLSDEDIKVTQYSKRAYCDLYQGIQKIPFEKEDKNRIIKDILEQTALMHDQSKVHQDIKTNNILLYLDRNGFSAKLADFGISYDSRDPYAGYIYACSSITYESPEISLAYEASDSPYHNSFHRNSLRDESLGYHINMHNPNRDPNSKQAKKYRSPDPANDMWALGIVFFQLEYGYTPTFSKKDLAKIKADPLLNGLLQVNRENRFTVHQALECFHSTQKPAEPSERKNALRFSETLSNITPEVVPASFPTPLDIEFLLYNKPNSSKLCHKFIQELEKLRANDPSLLEDTLKTIAISDLNTIRLTIVADPPPAIRKYNLQALSDMIEQCVSEKNNYIKKSKNARVPPGMSLKDQIEKVIRDSAIENIINALQERNSPRSPRAKDRIRK